MAEEPSPTQDKPIDAAICIDAEVYARSRAVLRHLCVGLVDLLVGVRVLTSTAEAASLNLGPVQAVVHEPLRWPVAQRRFRALVEKLGGRPPTLIHAMSGASYRLAQRLAEEFKADLVYQVSALADCQALRRSGFGKARRLICASQPLFEICTQKHRVPEQEAALVRPGVSCVEKPTCFEDDSREATILSTAPLTSGGGVEALVRALHLLHTRKHQCLMFLLGKGPDESKLRQLVKRLGLVKSVVFAQPAGDIRRAMVGADIFVQPAPERAILAGSLQALAQGLAVVAVGGGVADVFIPNKTALVCEVSTTDFVGSIRVAGSRDKAPRATTRIHKTSGARAVDLAAGIERFLTDHAFARELAANAIAHMRAHNAMSAMAEKTAAVYRSFARRA